MVVAMVNGIAEQLQFLRLPQVADIALSPAPAWLWSSDGDRLLWSNAAGARVFAHPDTATAVAHGLKLNDPHRRQIMPLARRITAVNETRLERLRGFGAPLGSLATCACTRLPLGGTSVLLVIAQPPLRPLSPHERLHGLIGGETPIVILNASGGASDQNDAARGWPFMPHLLTDPALLFLVGDALENGHAAADLAAARVEIVRTGGAEPMLIAAVVPSPACAPQQNAATHDEVPAAAGPDQPAEPRSVDPAPIEPQQAVEYVRQEPAPPMAANEPSATPYEPSNDTGTDMDPTPPSISVSPPGKLPLRFIWRTDADGRFILQSQDFAQLIGPQTAQALSGAWAHIAADLNLDPSGDVAAAMTERRTLSGLAVSWPTDDPHTRIPAELSGVPFYENDRQFAGYRGFGLVRALAALPQFLSVPPIEQSAQHEPAQHEPHGVHAAAPAAALAEPDPSAEPPQNVVPFRPVQPPAQDVRPTLTPVENSAFNELARQLSARLDDTTRKTVEPPAPIAESEPEPSAAEASAPPAETPGWLAPVAELPRGHSQTDLAVLDRMPAGVLIYKLDRLLYANRVFLEQIGYGDLPSLTDAGGLDALFVEPGVPAASSMSDTGTPVRVSSDRSSNPPADAALHTIVWDGEQAMALIFSGTHAVAAPLPAPAPPAPPRADNREAEQFSAILEAVPDALIVLDDTGMLQGANRSARELFAIDAASPAHRAFAELFAPESRTAVQDAVEAARSGSDVRNREVLAYAPDGSLTPLSMTVSRTTGAAPATFAVLRDLTIAKKTEAQLLGAQRQADRAASVKADVLARISHEVRMPLNSIIGFAEVMIGERFGALGNERYAEYMKDIRASGERVIAIINDMLDLSHIETGKLDLTLASQDLNDLVEQCVGVMQPQANRERIIIRTSLARSLPRVMADARSLRQIAMNLIGSSIHLANAGGQVIVSTALSDFGDVVLRVRDTGQGLNDNEMAAALAPFRAPVSPNDVTPANSGVSLSLTKALVEANHAHFQIKSSPQSGTLIEVRFPATSARASAQ